VGKWGEMTQTLYVHMNKKIKIKYNQIKKRIFVNATMYSHPSQQLKKSSR
jgi:hypothetical protein